jgi:ABC-type glutathione transport system ATPase component
VLFLPRGLIPTVSGWKNQRQGQDQQQPDPERLRLTPSGTITPEGGHPQGPVQPPHLLDGNRRAEEPAPVAPDPAALALTGTVLEVRALSRSFGGLRAVDDVDLDLAPASVTGLLGPNGSGKTTLFNLIDGTVRPSSGRLTLAGRWVDRAGRQARAHAGLARTYQLPRLFPSLTVLENVVLAERRLSLARLFLPRVTAAERARAMPVLADLGLAQHASTSPAALSYGPR